MPRPIDLLLPTTDAGVAIQLAVVMAVGVGAWLALRGRREARLVVAGVTLMLLAGMALRALH